jgi:hypothetical protein
MFIGHKLLGNKICTHAMPYHELSNKTLSYDCFKAQTLPISTYQKITQYNFFPKYLKIPHIMKSPQPHHFSLALPQQTTNRPQ